MTDEIQIQKLQAKIVALQNKCSSEGLIGSGAFCQMLCDLLLQDINTYINDTYSQILNDIKSNKLSAPD